MDIRVEIAERVEKLSPEMQEEVLRFIATLRVSPIKGESGEELLRYAGILDPASARQMTEAIEEECERVNDRDW